MLSGRVAPRLFIAIGTLIFMAFPTVLFADEVPSTVGGAILGKGYDSHDQAYRGDCLAFDPSKVLYVGAQGATVAFDRSLSQSEVQDSLGFSSSARAQFGVVTTSLAAGFAKEATADDYSDTTVYKAVYNFKNAFLNSSDLQTFAQNLRGTGAFIPSAFQVSCGDEYVKQVRLGAALYFSTKISFSTRDQKNRFDGSFSISGAFNALSGSLSTASSQFASSASIQVSAYQIGGRVDRLSTIFSDGTVQQASGSVHAIIVCSMSNLTPCLKVIDNALNYASNPTDPNAFPQQISPNFDPRQPGGPAELAYILEPWSNIGLQVPPKIVTDVINAQRSSLSGILAQQLQFRARLDDLKLRTFRLSTDQASLVNTYSDTVDHNLSGIADAAITCYTDDIKCPQAVTNLRQSISSHPIDPLLLDIVPETFAQWCDYSGYGTAGVPPTAPLKATRTTVEALVALARKSGVNTQDDSAWSKVGDQCGYADQLLEQQTRIGLPALGLSDLRPLSELSQMRYLDLSGNQIDDQGIADGQIGKLQNLYSLNLSNNALQSADTLRSLGSLRTLDISSNHISDVQTLSNLSNLLVLKASGNPLTCKDTVRCCPLLSVNAICRF